MPRYLSTYWLIVNHIVDYFFDLMRGHGALSRHGDGILLFERKKCYVVKMMRRL